VQLLVWPIGRALGIGRLIGGIMRPEFGPYVERAPSPMNGVNAGPFRQIAMMAGRGSCDRS
jgi:hypothetical protein